MRHCYDCGKLHDTKKSFYPDICDECTEIDDPGMLAWMEHEGGKDIR